MAMAKLQMLKPRVATLRMVRAAPLTTATVRITGSRLQARRQRIMTRANGLCECDECKAAPVPRLGSEVDHRIPLWEGGPDTDENCQLLAPECHARKSAEEAKRRAGRGGADRQGPPGG